MTQFRHRIKFNLHLQKNGLLDTACGYTAGLLTTFRCYRFKRCVTSVQTLKKVNWVIKVSQHENVGKCSVYDTTLSFLYINRIKNYRARVLTGLSKVNIRNVRTARLVLICGLKLKIFENINLFNSWIL